MSGEDNGRMLRQFRHAQARRPVHTGCVVVPDKAGVVLQGGERVLNRIPGRGEVAQRAKSREEQAFELEELNRKPGRLANLALRGL